MATFIKSHRIWYETYEVTRGEKDDIQLDLQIFFALEDDSRLRKLLHVALDDDAAAENTVGKGVVDSGVLVPPPVFGLETVEVVIESLVGVRLVHEVDQPFWSPVVEEVYGPTVEERVRRDAEKAHSPNDPASATCAQVHLRRFVNYREDHTLGYPVTADLAVG